MHTLSIQSLHIFIISQLNHILHINNTTHVFNYTLDIYIIKLCNKEMNAVLQILADPIHDKNEPMDSEMSIITSLTPYNHDQVKLIKKRTHAIMTCLEKLEPTPAYTSVKKQKPENPYVYETSKDKVAHKADDSDSDSDDDDGANEIRDQDWYEGLNTLHLKPGMEEGATEKQFNKLLECTDVALNCTSEIHEDRVFCRQTRFCVCVTLVHMDPTNDLNVKLEISHDYRKYDKADSLDKSCTLKWSNEDSTKPISSDSDEIFRTMLDLLGYDTVPVCMWMTVWLHKVEFQSRIELCNDCYRFESMMDDIKALIPVQKDILCPGVLGVEDVSDFTQEEFDLCKRDGVMSDEQRPITDINSNFTFRNDILRFHHVYYICKYDNPGKHVLLTPLL